MEILWSLWVLTVFFFAVRVPPCSIALSFFFGFLSFLDGAITLELKNLLPVTVFEFSRVIDCRADEGAAFTLLDAERRPTVAMERSG